MQIQKIIGEKGEMPQFCNGGGCPAVILTDEETIFVQGYIPSADERSHLAGPSGEEFVRMSRATFEKIARQVIGA